MSHHVLVIVAHADDEALGCGGTIARHVAKGDTVAAIRMTDGVSARASVQEGDAQRRRTAAQSSADALGFTWLGSGAFPDNGMDAIPLLDVVRLIEQSKRAFEPALVYTHHGGDLNVDHRVVFQAVLTAFRPEPAAALRELRTFEVASSTEWNHPSAGAAFAPNLFVGIEAFWPRKEASLRAYGSELRGAPHARSIEGVRHLAALRGYQAGLPLAEAFAVVRHLIP